MEAWKKCPCCGTGNICELDQEDLDLRVVRVLCRCKACESRWIAHYDFGHIEITLRGREYEENVKKEEEE